MCMLCGDPYSVEYVLGPLLAQQNCYLSSGERSIAIETQLGGDTKRKVEVVLSSYHGATDFRSVEINPINKNMIENRRYKAAYPYKKQTIFLFQR